MYPRLLHFSFDYTQQSTPYSLVCYKWAACGESCVTNSPIILSAPKHCFGWVAALFCVTPTTTSNCQHGHILWNSIEYQFKMTGSIRNQGSWLTEKTKKRHLAAFLACCQPSRSGQKGEMTTRSSRLQWVFGPWARHCNGSLLVAFSIIVSYFNNCMQYLLLYHGSFILSGQPSMNFVFW